MKTAEGPVPVVGPKTESLSLPCPVCPHACERPPGKPGRCGARAAQGGEMASLTYGKITALALDPIEKKPLARFHPGSRVLSVGSWGCNLRCPFCQNHSIAHPAVTPQEREMSPAALVEQALGLRAQGNIGIAFTYNEPGVGFEYLRDTAGLARTEGLKTVMVTNGYLCPAPFEELLGHLDALNIDLKCYTEEGYRRLGGSLETVRRSIAAAAARTHVEVTTLVVPGLSDREEDMERQAAWLASLSPEIPLHLSRYFPRWQATAPPTDPALLHRLAAIARGHLRHVYLGNI